MGTLWLLAAALAVGCGDTRQTEACRVYVDCIQALDLVQGRSTDLARFEAEGACWGGTTEGRDACDRACDQGLTWLQAHQEPLPEDCR